MTKQLQIRFKETVDIPNAVKVDEHRGYHSPIFLMIFIIKTNTMEVKYVIYKYPSIHFNQSFKIIASD